MDKLLDNEWNEFQKPKAGLPDNIRLRQAAETLEVCRRQCGGMTEN